MSKDSNKQGLLQLILEGEISFRKYTEIDFTTISQKGSEQNFYFELIDRIKPLGEGLEFSVGEVLNPRKRLEEAALEAIDKAANEHEQKIWQQAMNYAVEYYLKEQDK